MGKVKFSETGHFCVHGDSTWIHCHHSQTGSRAKKNEYSRYTLLYFKDKVYLTKKKMLSLYKQNWKQEKQKARFLNRLQKNVTYLT